MLLNEQSGQISHHIMMSILVFLSIGAGKSSAYRGCGLG